MAFSLPWLSSMANGYPQSFISKYNQSTASTEPYFGPDKKPIFLKVPFMGDSETLSFKRRLRHYTGAVYPAARPRVILNTTAVWSASLKDRIPAIGKSKIIYEFKCGCGSSYIGRTDRCLSTRVAEHLPKWLMQGGKARPRSSAAPSSACSTAVCLVTRSSRSLRRRGTILTSVISRQST